MGRLARSWLWLLFVCTRRAPWLVDLAQPLVVWGAWTFARDMREATLANAARILGPPSGARERKRLARAVINTFYEHVRDFGAPRTRGAAAVRVVGLEHYEDARRTRRGAVIVTAHLGAFEAAVAQLSAREPAVHVVFRRDRFHAFERLRRAQRERLAVVEAAIDDGPSTWLRLRDALRRDEVVLMQGDRTPPGERGVPAPFLHGHVLIPTGPARLARLTGSPIVPIFSVRDKGDIVITIMRSIDPERGDDDVCRELASAMAGLIARYPEQWLVLDKAWVEDKSVT